VGTFHFFFGNDRECLKRTSIDRFDRKPQQMRCPAQSLFDDCWWPLMMATVFTKVGIKYSSSRRSQSPCTSTATTSRWIRTVRASGKTLIKQVTLGLSYSQHPKISKEGIDRPGLNLTILVHMSISTRGFSVSVFLPIRQLKWFQISFSFSG
jgi:hypothetical protein